MRIIVIGGGGDACVIAVCERDCVLGIDEAHGVLGVMLALYPRLELSGVLGNGQAGLSHHPSCGGGGSGRRGGKG